MSDNKELPNPISWDRTKTETSHYDCVTKDTYTNALGREKTVKRDIFGNVTEVKDTTWGT